MIHDGEMTAQSLAIVTGAAHGIGLATAQRLALDGYRVLAIDRDHDELATADLPDGTVKLEHDIAFESGPVKAALHAASLPVGALVNNVGIMDGRSFLELPLEAAEQALRTNVLGTWRVTRLVVDRMISTKTRGSIVFNLSLHSSQVRMCPDYSVSKAGLRMLAEELASELGPHGIRVNSVSPGAIDTWSDRIEEPEEQRRRSEAVVALRRIGAPEDVASVISFLCDPGEAGYVTGADIRVDGGLSQFNWLHHLYGTAAAEQDVAGPAVTGG